ncbi:MAG: tRNA uridine-5-carboxymethylaminomethyl(34) synthesis GTPase MnmE [Ignavibacterium album]|jgi:tRNA modification GTPase|uniref:tRNA uridine-5-carboxymethylaminomethyl(34) synthesis GTPase MnmE n=1 Tax=Ignavibacterium album TaxID=591197 RepID=UPI0026F02B29|nr:tRNA uridine-5-carboxymethylaminomethyl(34) synthesis GTPase MnmE [Ignavibacterium album]MCX8105975.1 tRNA uridine-5-carboxymethylaminomethyl(34) synthesis GTPase MnmE [Ignavibacterium album]
MKIKEDTIIALATPPGVGAISVIRISGPDSFSLTDKLFKGKHLVSEVASHTVHYGFISDSRGEYIDDVLVTVFRAPNSYTGEDSVEISTHGNPLIAQKIIGEFLLLGNIRLAEPGEFTKRAFLNNRIDLSQAEAVADIIHARSEASLRGARNQLDGMLSQKVTKLRESLINTTSFIELELDFAEEDIEFVNSEELLKRIDEIIIEVDSLLETYNVGRVIRDGVNVALVGKPNVGKSSILNYLLKESRSIVSDIPGTTRDIIREEISINGILFRLFDTAGLRDSENPIEEEGIRRSREVIKSSDVVLYIEDTQQESSRELFEELLNISSGDKVIRVLNKIDLNDKINFEADCKVSAKTGKGMDRLLKALVQKTVGTDYYTERTAIVTNQRHYACLKKARESLLNARNSVISKASGEFISIDLRNASLNLGEIIGEVTTDDILNNIFMKFCIGK